MCWPWRVRCVEERVLYRQSINCHSHLQDDHHSAAWRASVSFLSTTCPGDTHLHVWLCHWFLHKGVHEPDVLCPVLRSDEAQCTTSRVKLHQHFTNMFCWTQWYIQYYYYYYYKLTLKYFLFVFYSDLFVKIFNCFNARINISILKMSLFCYWTVY